MIRSKEATGKTVEEARAAACAALGVSEDDLNVSYEVLEMPQSTGFLGLKKIYDPEKVKAEVAAEIEAKRKEQRRGVKSTTIKVVDEKTGKTVEKNISASEMNKRRLEYARMLDEEKYKDERTVPLSELGQNKED